MHNDVAKEMRTMLPCIKARQPHDVVHEDVLSLRLPVFDDLEIGIVFHSRDEKDLVGAPLAEEDVIHIASIGDYD